VEETVEWRHRPTRRLDPATGLPLTELRLDRGKAVAVTGEVVIALAELLGRVAAMR
jgi:hypothetical protein